MPTESELHSAPPALVDLMLDHVKRSIENGMALVQGTGISAEVALQATELAIAAVALGTFQARMRRHNGLDATPHQASEAMAALVSP